MHWRTGNKSWFGKGLLSSLARRRRFTLTCFVMHVCVRLCGRLAICPSLSAEPVGAACRLRISLLVTKRLDC